MAHLLNKEISAGTNRNILTFLLLAGLWLFAHPYRGVDHDSVLYNFQALSRLYPWLHGDLFFAYGSQDDYSVFSRIYAWVISGVGLQNASMLVVGICQCVWLWMAWRISALLPAAERMVFLALLFALPGYYAYTNFEYGEMFVTARIISEAVSLAAIAAMFSGRRYLAWGLILCAAAIHPLMAAGGILFLLLFQGQTSWRRFLTAAILLAILFVALVSVLGLWGRFAVMDPQWYALVRDRNTHIFILLWRLPAQNQLLLSLSVLFIAWKFAETPVLKRLFAAVLVIGGMAVALSLISQTLWHCQLLIQVQPARMLWLAKWFSFLGFATLVRRDAVGRWIPMLLAVAWFTSDSIGGVLALVTVGLSCSAWRLKSVPKWSLVFLLLIIGYWVWECYTQDFREVLYNTRLCDGHGHGTECRSAFFATFLMLKLNLVVLFGVCAACLLYRVWITPGKMGSQPTRFFVMFTLVTFVFSAVIFSCAKAETKPYFPDRHTHMKLDDFAAHIPQNAVVYWPDDLVKTWYYLGRRSYYSWHQSSGALFSRPATFEMKRRADRVVSLSRVDAVWNNSNSSFPRHSHGEMRRGLFSVCRDRKLDDVVLDRLFPGLAVASWSDKSEHKVWWLYECDKIRHNLK